MIFGLLALLNWAQILSVAFQYETICIVFDTNFSLFCFRWESGLFRRQQEEEGRPAGSKRDHRVTYDESANRSSQRNGITVAAGRGPVVPQSFANLLESGNSRGRRRGLAKSRRLLLAAEHRNSRGCTQGEGSPNISGTLKNGGTDYEALIFNAFCVKKNIKSLIFYFHFKSC